jgi:hypothetical protein
MQSYFRLVCVCVVSGGVLFGCGDSSFPTGPSPTPTVTAPAQPTPVGPYTVSGVVSEVVDGRMVPLEGAHVEDSQRHVSVKTASDGSYTLTNVVESSLGGAYIYFAKDGFRSQSRQFALTGDTRLDVTLVRQ